MGVDVLADDGFKQLSGKNIGLITNHTGLLSTGESTIDRMHASSNIRIKALFGPEHGVRGSGTTVIADALDDKTGLPVFSLYGPRRAPSQEQIRGIDTFVYDIQDIGCRYYTYIATLVHCMRSANEAHIPIIVLDRPNPISGHLVEGPITDTDKLSFVAIHTIPIRHGLTTGELARLIQKDTLPTVDLRVVLCDGWKRKDWFHSTGATWIDPSPNMRSLIQATIYPGPAQLEFTNVSVGRGTPTPFQLFGAPWIDEHRFAAALNDLEIDGVGFVPRRFIPTSQPFQQQECRGVEIIVTNMAMFKPVKTGVAMAITLRKLYPTLWIIDRWQTLLCHQATFDAVSKGADIKTVEHLWDENLSRYKKRRQSILSYS